MKRKPETTSAAIASLAGHLLKEMQGLKPTVDVRAIVYDDDARCKHCGGYTLFRPLGKVHRLRKIAASCLTQAADKPKRQSAAKTKKENQW